MGHKGDLAPFPYFSVVTVEFIMLKTGGVVSGVRTGAAADLGMQNAVRTQPPWLGWTQLPARL